jgi:RNA polymerase sigma factor (TIGR02999 family)
VANEDIGKLIAGADAGDTAAAEQLFASLYAELHRLAERTLHRQGPSVTLGATTLLHEAYLNITSREGTVFADRARFLSYASRAMRGLVIDYVRRRGARKRGRQFEVTLATNEPAEAGRWETAEELERLADALDELGAIDPAPTELVDLHFFCGYSFAEVAALRDVSERTVQRDWRKARLLLHRSLVGDAGTSHSATADSVTPPEA